MKTFKLTAAQVSEKYFGEPTDLATMQSEQQTIENTLKKALYKILSSEIDGNLNLTITYEPIELTY